MKRNDDEFLAEISRRANVLTKQRKRRKTTALALCCCAGMISLSVLAFYIKGNPLPAMSAAVFLQNPAVGGYLLTGVLSFAGGVLATLVSIRHKRKQQEEDI